MLLPGLLLAANPPVPDLTTGGLPTDAVYTNLGATGMHGWFYHVQAGGDGTDTDASRQILVTSVDPGSPASGILAVSDVILGADGTGAGPVNFSSDARKSLAYAIQDAEARTPATLNLLRWRAGRTATVAITLQTMGTYTATAPYNCPKSAKILEQGLQHAMTSESPDGFSFGALALMAADDPSNPNNAARQAQAKAEAYALILTPDLIAEYTSGNSSRGYHLPWFMGHQLIVLAEYYLHTGDAAVLPSVRAMAIQISNGQSMFGTLGHQFAMQGADGSINGPYAVGYGPVNSAGMPCFLGLVLARKCGLTDPQIAAGVNRASNFFNVYVDRGCIPYGENKEQGGFETNGRCSMAALSYALQGNNPTAVRYFSKSALASAGMRDGGHTGPYFNYIWAPLGANLSGPAAAAAYFSTNSWMLDLSRRWDGGFEYNTYDKEGGDKGETALGGLVNLNMSTTALLTYAMPLTQLEITGKGQDQSLWLDATGVSNVIADSLYNPTTRTTAQLVADLGSWAPPVRWSASAQLGTRTADYASVLPTLASLATDPAGTSRIGAIFALGYIDSGNSAQTLASLLTDPVSKVRYTAAASMAHLSQASKMGQLSTILKAAVTTARPTLPIDPQDPLHLDTTTIGQLLFASGSGVIAGNRVIGVDRNSLYPAIRAMAAAPQGSARSSLTSIYPYLGQADMNALADVFIDTIQIIAPADLMGASPARTGGLQALQAHWISEGVPLAEALYNEASSADELLDLQKYAGSSLGVLPDPKVVAFCKYIVDSDPTYGPNAQAVLDAIVADTSPVPATPFKSIQSVTADAPTLTLPAKWTALHAKAMDYAKGDSVYTWRMVHGAGSVSFSPNGTSASKDTTVLFGGVPGQYLFEVKMSDSRGLTEVYGTVAVTLDNTGGTLPPNSPPAASAQTITTQQATPTPIVLTGSDPEGYPLTYAVTNQPGHGGLTGTGPYVVYTSNADYLGTDSFTFKVTDSEGQTATATVSLTVGATGPVGLAVYEPFNYPAGPLNGKSGSGSIGFSGTWTSSSSTVVAPGSFSYGGLLTAGGSIDQTSTLSDFNISRTLSTSALAGNHLLDNGASLWFSVMVGPGPNWGSRLTLALANSPFDNTSGNSWIMDSGPQHGSGLGLTLDNGVPEATQFQDVSMGSGITGNVFGTSVNTIPLAANERRLIVGRIVWGATSDTLEIYEPDTDLLLPADPVSSLTVSVDQSTYNTITAIRGAGTEFDEIRIGATYQSVIQGTVAMTPDLTAPTPNPMTFDTAAAPVGPSSIQMVASTAFDPTGVQYDFTCTAGGGHDSGWQDSPSYTDTGLTPGVLYSYKVMARDNSAAHNETALSAVSSATIPSQATVPDLTGMPQDAAASAILGAGLAAGSVTTSYNSTVPAGSVISQSPLGSTVLAYGSSVNLVVSLGYPSISPANFVDDKGGATVTPGTMVTYTLTFSWDMDASTVTASDFSNAGTAAITIGAITEISPGVFTVQVTPTNDGSLQLQIPAGAVLLDFGGRAVNTTSAITDDTVIWSTTDSSAPTPNPLTWVVVPTALSQTQITMTASTATDAHGPVQYNFVNTTTGDFSDWTTSPTWVESGLVQNTTYGYEVQARDALGNLTAWSTVNSATTFHETTPPVVVTLTPPDNSTNVALNQTFTVTFSEAIRKGTGNITFRDLTDSTSMVIAVTDATQVSVSGSVLTINPSGILGGSKNYAVQLPAGVITDLLGNPFGGIADTTTWNFTTEPPDTIPPAIVSLSPVDGATNVGLASNLVATFSEDIARGTGNITLRNLTDSTDTLISVTDTTQALISGSVLTINPSGIFIPNKDYAILLDAGTVKDLAGNAFAGITANTTWNFHTLTPPALTVYTGSASGSTDSWNLDTNWDSGSGHVPAGTTNVEIAAGKVAVSNSTSTPPYTGNLTLDPSATLQVYKNTQDLSALGTGTITMQGNSTLSLLTTQTRTISLPIQLVGNATLVTGASTGGSVKATFSAPINGLFSLSLLGNGGSQNHFAAANTFYGLTASQASANNWDWNWQVYGDAAGSLGVGNVTLNTTVSLVVTADNAMANCATLYLVGAKSSQVASKLVMNANNTIAALYIDGVKQPDGSYINGSQSWISGTGTLTVGGEGGVDVIRPTLARSSIVDDRSGGPIYTNSLVTYTVTFSEAMDSSTISTSDFGNAGSCSVTINSVIQTSPAVFTVQVTPTSTGNLQLWVPAGALLRDVAGNAVDTSSAILDDTSITVVTPPDITPPTVASLNPPAGATNVALWSGFAATFSEAIQTGTGTITLRNLTDAIDTVIDVTDATRVSISGSVLTIKPSANLLAAKSYAIRISAGAVKDLSFNPYAGIADDSTWSFSTVAVEPLATFVGANNSAGDNWNVAANWSPSGIPSGATSVLIPANKYVTTSLTTSTPVFAGNLTIGAGATVQCGYTTLSLANFNALGTAGSTAIVMNEGSTIMMRGAYSPAIPAIKLLGNANLTLGASTSGSPTPTFASGINGPYTLTVTGKIGAAMNLTTVPNTFSKIVFAPTFGSAFSIDANVAGALGGDVTVLPDSTGILTANLVIGAAEAIPSTATLSLDGPASPIKLKLLAPDTIAKLLVDGVQLPDGTYGKPGSGALYEVSWIDTTSTHDFLTVSGSPSNYWDINGTTVGAGGATPTGVWDLNTSANWNTAANGTGTPALWSAFAGQTAVFAAGTDAIGTYAVTVSGTQDIGGLRVEEGNVTLSGDGIRMTSDSLVSVSSGASATLASVISNDTAHNLTKGGAGTLGLTGANTYTGNTRLEGGTLTVASLANAGTNSPIGNYPTAGAGGLTLVGGTFQYTGSSAATNRGINFSGNSTIDVNTAATTLTVGDCASVVGSGTLTVTGGTGSRLALGQVQIVEAAQLTLNPTTIPVTVAAVNGYTSYPNTSILTLAGTATGNVVTGAISATNPPTSGFSEPINVVKSGTNDWSINGVFSGGGTLTVNGGSLTLNAANTYSGITTVQSGSLIAGTNAPNNAAGALGSTTSEVVLGVAGGTGNAAILTGGPYTIARPIRIPTTNNTDYGARLLTLGGNTADSSVFSGSIYLGTVSNAGHGITLSAASGGTVTFSGVIQDPATMDVTLNYVVTKAGAGTVALSNTNTYTAATAVNSGTLLVNAPGSLAAASAVTVNNTATLGGSGTIGGNVTVAAGGNIAPGATTGTLTISGNLDISAMAAGVLKYDLAAIGASDQIVVGGTLNIGSAALGFSNFNFSNVGVQNGTYTLISASAITGTLKSGNLSGPVGTGTGTLQISGNTVQLTVAGINFAPTWTSNPITGANATQGGAYAATLAGKATDVNGDPLTYARVSGPAWLGVAPDGTLSGTPGSGDVGANSFTVSVSDGIAAAVPATLNLTVIGTVNHFVISAIASPQMVGTAITGITVTAQDTLNATATSFTGTVAFGGTGGFSGTSASFTAGVLSGASVTPTVSGSNLTLTVSDGASHSGTATIATINPAPDITPPTIVSTNPANGSTAVTVSTNLVVTFSESVAIGTGNITLKNLTDSTQTLIPVTDSSQVSVSGSVLTINPNTDLTRAKSYSVRIDSTAVRDLSNNYFAGIADDTTWAFTATSATPPLTWDANGTTANQTDGAAAWLGTNQWWNGTANVTWASGSDAVFGKGGAGGAVSLASPTTVNSITFNSFSGTYTLGTAPQTITLTTGLTKNSGSGVVTIVSPVTLGGAQTWSNNSASTLNFNGTVTLNNGGNLLTLQGTGAFDFSTASGGLTVTGGGGLTVDGARVTLAGSSGRISTTASYTGTTTIQNGGNLMYYAALGTGNLTINGGYISGYYGNNMTRTLGTGTGQIQLAGGVSGFSEEGNSSTVTLNNNAGYEVVWGAANEAGNASATGFFNPSTLAFQSAYCNSGKSITFANKLDLNGTTRTIQVGKDASTPATISGVIRTSSGTAGLIKTGVGKLILSAANTYNGDTTVSAGTLQLNSANTHLAASTVTIAATGATLNLNFTGTDTVNRLYVGSTPMAAGVYGTGNIVIPQITGTGTLTVTSSGPGPVDHFAISAIGSPQTTGTAITGLTLIAQDVSSATATSFTGTVSFGGTAGCTGTSGTFTAGVLTGVSVTPTVAGGNLTFTVNDGAGHGGSATIATVRTPYQAWAVTNAPTGTAKDDADADGVSNGVEYVLGGSKTTNNVAKLPKISTSGGNVLFTFKRAQASIDGSTIVAIEVGPDLATWPNAYNVGADTAHSSSGVTVVKDSSPGFDTITLSVPQAGGGKFARLKVLVPTP